MQLRYVSKRNPRKKKFQHFKLKCRKYVQFLSLTANFITVLYFLELKYNGLTNIIAKVTPIMESLINHLPL